MLNVGAGPLQHMNHVTGILIIIINRLFCSFYWVFWIFGFWFGHWFSNIVAGVYVLYKFICQCIIIINLSIQKIYYI